METLREFIQGKMPYTVYRETGEIWHTDELMKDVSIEDVFDFTRADVPPKMADYIPCPDLAHAKRVVQELSDAADLAWIVDLTSSEPPPGVVPFKPKLTAKQKALAKKELRREYERDLKNAERWLESMKKDVIRAEAEVKKCKDALEKLAHD